MACPPVLVLAFNRPDTTQRVLESLRAARPREVFFAVDGARAQRDAERERVFEVRRLTGTIDWECRIHTLFREENLGCKLAVSHAITWFFSEVESGVVIEDDCIADPSFFRFAAELLDRYRDDERVIVVSGDNFQLGRRRTADSYYFSRYVHVWGWASWRRAWRLYDHAMASWPQLRKSGWLTEFLNDKAASDYWTRIFDETHADQNTSWAYRWVYAAWANDRLSAVPSVNLVSNIGFGGNATHNLNRWNRFASLAAEAMRFPLVHPAEVVRQQEADDFTQRKVFTRPLWRRLAGQFIRALRA